MTRANEEGQVSNRRGLGEAIGGWATAVALIVSIVTFIYTYNEQRNFNKEQKTFNEAQVRLQREAAELQKEANQEQRRAAEAQRETAAVEALGRYLDKTNMTSESLAWESAEAIIDVMGPSADDAWKATAKRAIYHHPSTLQNFECELYSKAFKDFVVSFTTTRSLDDLCNHRAHFMAPSSFPARSH